MRAADLCTAVRLVPSGSLSRRDVGGASEYVSLTSEQLQRWGQFENSCHQPPGPDSRKCVL